MADEPRRRRCATSEVHRLLLNTDPEYARNRSDIENFSDVEAARGFAAAVPKVRTINVVVHVVYKTSQQNISDAQVKSQIRILNEDYAKKNTDATKVPAPFKPLHADTRIQFRLATKDVFGAKSNGITRTKTTRSSFSFNDAVKASSSGGADPWPAHRYLNVWVCNLGGGLLGYAQFPGDRQ